MILFVFSNHYKYKKGILNKQDLQIFFCKSEIMIIFVAMNWKKYLYIGLVFCTALLLHFQDAATTVVENPAETFAAAETDFLFPSEEKSEEKHQFNDEAIAPVSDNAITGRHEHNSSSGRVLNEKRFQNRHALIGDNMSASTVIRPGNFTDNAFMLYPSGLHSSIHHLILLRKLRN